MNNKLVAKVAGKKLDVLRRRNALTALDRVKLVQIKREFYTSAIIMKVSLRCGLKERSIRSRNYMMKLLQQHDSIALIPYKQMWYKADKPDRKYITIDSLNDEEVPINYRFKNKCQLQRLYVGFQFPPILRTLKGEKFTGEEVFLCGIRRLSFPNRTVESYWKREFGFRHQDVSKAFNLFLGFIQLNWAYLLLDHLNFWKPYLKVFAESIRQVVVSMGCYFPPAGSDNGFAVAAFIDNTMNATCRPAGGPARDGKNAPRNDRFIQQAWYNGWKKLHGLKWQTVDFPNGMNGHVYGPISIRRNDLTTANWSRINELWAALQQGEEYQYTIYGDSAYIVLGHSHIKARHTADPMPPRLVLENKCLSSCRETIEWDYGDIGTLWATLQYKKMLKMRSMPVGNMCLTAMILRNAHVTMNGCNTSEYFQCLPPTFEEWIKEGPRYCPLPFDVR